MTAADFAALDITPESMLTVYAWGAASVLSMWAIGWVVGVVVGLIRKL